MTICFFGAYNQNYSRNKILLDGLKKNRIEVLHCHSNEGSFVQRYPQLIKQFLKIHSKVDIIYVAFVGHLDVPLAWIFSKLTGKKVVFDMFYSMYDTYVYDRKSTQPGTFRAKTYYWIDKLAGSMADLVITDTKAHANYFIKTFKLNKNKFGSVFVGGDDTEFKPLRHKKNSKKIIIEFHGMFTRLHGAEFYVQAAKKLENEKNMEFWLIGSTKNYFLPIELYKKLKPKNMKYFPELSVQKLAEKIAESDISIGHIGTTEKARSVITNKTFHALNSKVASIVGDCEANRELLADRKNALFVKMGDENDLAKKIKILANNSKLREKIAEAGYALSQEKLTNERLGKLLLKRISSL